jgi:sterol desaturase/sphingolipid hydroxylase (fatty acid hydroxylase superfamily)
MTEFFTMLVDGLSRPLAYFINPAQRLFIPAILTSIVMAIGAYFYYQRKGKVEGDASAGNMARWLFPKKIWTHRSSVVDYQLIFLNAVIYVFLTTPFLVYMALLTGGVTNFLIATFGEVEPVAWSHATILAAFTIAIFVVDDFLRYFQHWLLHKVPAFWNFHKVHHTAEVLTPFTNYRNHPCETFIYHCRRFVSYGLVAGTFLFFVGNNLTLLDMVYAGTIRKVFNHVGSNLRHTHIWFSWGNFIEHFIISPAQHQIHHSDAVEHRDKNMGSMFAIWDWMFGTLVIAGEKKELHLGVSEEQNKRHRSLTGAVVAPFVDTWNMILRFPETLKRLTDRSTSTLPTPPQ